VTQINEDPRIVEIKLTPVTTNGEIATIEGMTLEGMTAPRRRASFGGYGLFASLVIAPFLLAILYLFGVASDRYLSQAQFIVRSSSTGGFESTASAVSSHGLSRAQDETYIVCEYIESRDALAWLDKNEGLRDIFNSPAADFINRYPNFHSRRNMESYFRHYKRLVSCEVDSSTGITTVSAQAFSPEDAQKIAGALLLAAEDLLNRMNQRAVSDAVAVADTSVEEAKAHVVAIEQKLRTYRSQVGFISDQSENASAQKTITALSTELAQMNAALQQQAALTPDSPTVRSTRSQIASYESEIARRQALVAGGAESIASKMGDLDALDMEKLIAQKEWASAESSRDMALQNARRQQLYLQPVVQPNVEDQPSYPRRWLNLALTLIVAEMIFMIVRSLRQFAMEHSL
jgi:capsular polysaccharide transport system permease protein